MQHADFDAVDSRCELTPTSLPVILNAILGLVLHRYTKNLQISG